MATEKRLQNVITWLAASEQGSVTHVSDVGEYAISREAGQSLCTESGTLRLGLKVASNTRSNA